MAADSVDVPCAWAQLALRGTPLVQDDLEIPRRRGDGVDGWCVVRTAVATLREGLSEVCLALALSQDLKGEVGDAAREDDEFIAATWQRPLLCFHVAEAIENLQQAVRGLAELRFQAHSITPLGMRLPRRSLA